MNRLSEWADSIYCDLLTLPAHAVAALEDECMVDDSQLNLHLTVLERVTAAGLMNEHESAFAAVSLTKWKETPLQNRLITRIVLTVYEANVRGGA